MEVNAWLGANRLNPARLTTQEAESLVNHIRNSRNPAIRNFLNSLRPGSASIHALAAIGAKAIIIAGVTYAYEEYVGTGERVGLDLMNRLTLQQLLQNLERLPGRVFRLRTWDDKLIDIVITYGRNPGEYYYTASYTQESWNYLGFCYERRTVYIIPPGTYRVPSHQILDNRQLNIRALMSTLDRPIRVLPLEGSCK